MGQTSEMAIPVVTNCFAHRFSLCLVKFFYFWFLYWLFSFHWRFESSRDYRDTHLAFHIVIDHRAEDDVRVIVGVFLNKLCGFVDFVDGIILIA